MEKIQVQFQAPWSLTNISNSSFRVSDCLLLPGTYMVDRYTCRQNTHTKKITIFWAIFPYLLLLFLCLLICLFLFYHYYLDLVLYSDEGRKGCRFGWLVKRRASMSSCQKGSHNHNIVYKNLFSVKKNQWDKKLPFAIWLNHLFLYPPSRQNRTLYICMLHGFSNFPHFPLFHWTLLNILFSFVYLDNWSLLQCLKHCMHYNLNAKVPSLCKFLCYNIECPRWDYKGCIL